MDFNGYKIHSYRTIFYLRKEDDKLNMMVHCLSKERYSLMKKITDMVAMIDDRLIDEDSSQFIRRFHGIKFGCRFPE